MNDDSRRMIALGEAFKIAALAVLVTAFVSFAMWAGLELRELNERVENIQDQIHRLSLEEGDPRRPDQGDRRSSPSVRWSHSPGGLQRA